MSNKLEYIKHWLLLAFFASLPLSLHLNNYIFFALGMIWLFQLKTNFPFRINASNWALIGFFAVNLIGVFYSSNTDFALFNIEKKLQLLFFPIILSSFFSRRKSARTSFLNAFIISSFLLFSYSLMIASYRFSKSHSSDEFFYHQLADASGMNAIYLSLYLIISLILLLSRIQFLNYKSICVMLLGTIALGLLASKSILAIWLILMLYELFRLSSKSFIKKGITSIALITVSSLLVVFGPASERYGRIAQSKFEILKQERFDYKTPFDGLTLRLIFWKIALEIIEEEQAWLLGVGPGDSRNHLNEKFTEKGIYMGNKELGDHGYKNMNTHNQYVETTLKSGVLGLLLLLLIYLLGLAHYIQIKNPLFLIILLVFAAAMCTEALLETQKGLSLFCTLMVFFAGNNSKQIPQNSV